MKILPSIAGLILAGTFTSVAQAGPSNGQVMGECKAEIRASIDDISRLRTSRFKDRASGTYVTFKVSTADGESQLVKCTYRDGVASLENSDGKMIAGKALADNTGSE